MNSEINFNAILTHLSKYAGEKYTSPDRVPLETKDEMIERKKSGGRAADELHKLSKAFASMYDLIPPSKSKWLDGSNTAIRSYLWAQLKQEGHVHIPTSLSIFAEKVQGQVQFRLSIELKQEGVTEEDRERHHRLLDYPLPEDTHYSYVISTDQTLGFMNSDETAEEIRTKINSKEYKKVQLVYMLSSSEIEEREYSNENIFEELSKAFEILKQCYDYIIKDTPPSDQQSLKIGNTKESQSMYDKNIILYGPPGTGKTYHTVLYAVSIIEHVSLEALQSESYDDVLKRYNSYKVKNRIAFTTFHQSYGYEEFIEGIKPTLDSEQIQIEYQIQPGIFKDFCETASEPGDFLTSYGIKRNAQIWKVSLGGSGMNELKRDCFENNRIRIGWDHFGENLLGATKEPEGTVKDILNNFQNEMEEGDIVLSLSDQKHIDAIGVIIGAPEWLDSEENYVKDKNNHEIIHYKRSRKVKWLAKNIHENIFDLNGGKVLVQKTVYKLNRLTLQDIQTILQPHMPQQGLDTSKNREPYVFIIDEINRGNISKILGELITLIEPSKRIGADEEMKVQLPYSKTEFGVPDNIYILGTMNTADRSIALMDTALRRRFQFIEMMPDENVLAGVIVDSIRVEDMLRAMNQRIEVLYDREHMLGHAYFVSLKSNPTLEALSSIFINSIIPLLQEYFYEDYSKIQMVLGDNAKEDSLKFIRESDVNVQYVFKGNPEMDLLEKQYTLQRSAFSNPASYREIYE